MPIDFPDPPPRAWRYWPARAGVGLMAQLARLPYRLQRALGIALGALLFVFMRARRRYAARNLALCFPELAARERAALLRRHFRSMGIGAFEFMRAWWGSLAGLPPGTRVLGLEHLAAAQATGRGVLLLSGHFHSFELCGRYLIEQHPVGAMYRPYEHPVLEWAVRRGRSRYLDALFRRNDLRGAIRYLKRGGTLWYAPDQDMRARDSVFVPFFGVPANTITATHQLARLSGALVVPFRHRRRPDGQGYEVELLPALADFPSDDPLRDTARVSAVIEQLVRHAPEEYLWIHRRFKRRPPGMAKVYVRNAPAPPPL